MSGLLEPVDRAARALLAQILSGEADIPEHPITLAQLMEVATTNQLGRLEEIFFGTMLDADVWHDAWSLHAQTQDEKP